MTFWTFVPENAIRFVTRFKHIFRVLMLIDVYLHYLRFNDLFLVYISVL